MMNEGSNDVLQQVIDHRKHIAPIIHEPQNDDDYGELSGLLDKLLDKVGEDEPHELMGLVDVISHMISMYDKEHYQLEYSNLITKTRLAAKKEGLTKDAIKDAIAEARKK